MNTGKRKIMSMSGYGRATVRSGEWKAICEIRTVNHRNLDMSLNLPAGLMSADAGLRRLIRSRLDRGRVELSISIVPMSGGAFKPVLDRKLAFWYGRKLRSLARELRLPAPGMESIAALPGVLERGGEFMLPGAAVSSARRSASAALEGVREMRAREGHAMGRDVIRRLAGIERAASRLEREWIPARERQAFRTRERLSQALERLSQAGKSGLAKEIVHMVERGDVSEELTRLRSLCSQFRRTVKSGSPAGRKLDFMAQEIQREINTMSAKCAEASLTKTIMPAREEIERIREQVQNIE